MRITREFGFDMGHCLPDHEGGCYRPHGHRYRLEVMLDGDVVDAGPEAGMVMDFQNVKAVVTREVVDVLDHRFVMAERDPRSAGMLATFNHVGSDPSVLLVPSPPTAEYLVEWIAHRLQAAGLPVVWLRLWETPSCSAVWE